MFIFEWVSILFCVLLQEKKIVFDILVTNNYVNFIQEVREFFTVQQRLPMKTNFSFS